MTNDLFDLSLDLETLVIGRSADDSLCFAACGSAVLYALSLSSAAVISSVAVA